MFLHGIFILTDWLDKTSNISILSCKLQTSALLSTHVTVELPQMEGVAYYAIYDVAYLVATSNVRLARIGETIPPCGVPASVGNKCRSNI